jgi:hypothetical protein
MLASPRRWIIYIPLAGISTKRAAMATKPEILVIGDAGDFPVNQPFPAFPPADAAVEPIAA